MMKIEGMEFLAQLPEGYDERTRITVAVTGDLVVIHPEHPPLIITREGAIRELIPVSE